MKFLLTLPISQGAARNKRRLFAWHQPLQWQLPAAPPSDHIAQHVLILIHDSCPRVGGLGVLAASAAHLEPPRRSAPQVPNRVGQLTGVFRIDADSAARLLDQSAYVGAAFRTGQQW